MIERIHLVNFKNHADTRIELGRLTALIGPNSSGKTNVLQALLFVSRLADKPLNQITKGEWGLDFISRKGERSFRIEIEGEMGIPEGIPIPKTWSISVGASRKTPEGTWNPHMKQQWAGQSEPFEYDDAWNAQFGLGGPPELSQTIRNVAYIKLVSDNLRTPSYSEKNLPRVETDGSGLASVVAYLKTYEEKRFADVLSALRSIVPGVENIRVRPAPVRIRETQVFRIDDEVVPHEKDRRVMGHELIFDMAGAKEIPAHSVSEGTLLALALLTLLWSPDCPNLVLLDDIEQGLHPKAQRELIGQIRQILAQRPGLQIVLTSHSPYIVDELEAEEVWLLATDAEGVAQAKRLSDHPDARRVLEVLTTGEFWSAEGEDWVVADGT